MDVTCQDVVSVSLEQIASAWGVTYSRAWQIEQSALKKIRDAIEAEARCRGLTVKEWLYG